MGKRIKIFVVISLVLILVTPFLLTRSGFECLAFKDTGQIGDTIGGTTSPIIGFVSIVLLAYTLIEQLNFNKQQNKFNDEQAQLLRRQQFEVTFFLLLQEQRDIASSLETKYEGVYLDNPAKIQRLKVRGREFFKMGVFVLKNLFDSMENGTYCHSWNKSEIEGDLTLCTPGSENYFQDSQGKYHSFDTSTVAKVSKFRFLNDKYRITEEEFEAYSQKKIEDKIDFVYSRFFNVHEECGFYFRHLYRILYFVHQSEENELHEASATDKNAEISKYYLDLAQFIQAQMSPKEMLMVFYNSFSFPNLQELLIKYNILENLTVENLLRPEHNCIEEFHLKHCLD